MRVYRTRSGTLVEHEGGYYSVNDIEWDALINRDDLHDFLIRRLDTAEPEGKDALQSAQVIAPIGSQEVWAAGVTYFQSRDARMAESKDAGGDWFYGRVYDAKRPELFFKATPHRVVGPGEAVRIRRDSNWNVPEPELTLVSTSAGKIIGYTIGNDMSSREIEGENPLYLPQAKTYDKSCALGPCILVTEEPLPPSTSIRLEILRNEEMVFDGETTLAMLKREPQELVDYLYRESSFPAGSFLLTGTGIVPKNDFTLEPGDQVRIRIDGIGTLVNNVEQK